MKSSDHARRPTGHKSWDEKKAILGAVGHAPGVKMIHDHLFIDPYDARFALA